MGAPNLISDNMDCGLSYSVISYLKKLSQQVSLHYQEIKAITHKKNGKLKKYDCLYI